jgi:hypothetical protein
MGSAGRWQVDKANFVKIPQRRSTYAGGGLSVEGNRLKVRVFGGKVAQLVWGRSTNRTVEAARSDRLAYDVPQCDAAHSQPFDPVFIWNGGQILWISRRASVDPTGAMECFSVIGASGGCGPSFPAAKGVRP